MLQDIKDEVLSGEPLYTIRDSSGNVLNDNVDIYLKTPITQEGTPVNRALFRNLQGDLYTQDRYNEIEIAQNGSNFLANLSLPLTSYEKGKIINVVFKRTTTFYQKFSGNIIPLNWTATDTTYKTYTSGAGDELTVSGNSSTSSNKPDQAVDGNDSTYWSSDSNTSPYIIVNFAEPKKITKMNVKLLNSNSSRLISITISGSNDNSNFTELYKSTTTINGTVTLNNTNYYKYYKIIYLQSPTPVNAYVYRIETSEYENVKTEFDNLYLNINNLGAKQINGRIKYGEKYTLVYNGESFDIVSPFVHGTFTGKSFDSGETFTIDLGTEYRYVLLQVSNSSGADFVLLENGGTEQRLQYSSASKYLHVTLLGTQLEFRGVGLTSNLGTCFYLGIV